MEERSSFFAELRPRPGDPWPDIHSLHDNLGFAGVAPEDVNFGYLSRVADVTASGASIVHPRSIFMGFPSLEEVSAYFHGAGLSTVDAFDCRQFS